jgi:hypothetical protein
MHLPAQAAARPRRVLRLLPDLGCEKVPEHSRNACGAAAAGDEGRAGWGMSRPPLRVEVWSPLP